MKSSRGDNSKYGNRLPSSDNKRGDETFVQNRHIGRGGYNRSVISTRVQSAPLIPTPSVSYSHSNNLFLDHFKR